MARYRLRPDGDAVLELDHGPQTTLDTKHAAFITKVEAQDRVADRVGARELDQMLEQMPGLSRAARDRDRAFPRPGGPEQVNHRTDRDLPLPDAIRVPVSSRQRKTRSKTKRAVQDRMPHTQVDSVRSVITSPQKWVTLNDALADTAGDVQNLDDDDRLTVQRLDRAIRAYEQSNDRTHILYSRAAVPISLRGGLHATLSHQLRSGQKVSLDRFTAGAHTVHQVDPERGDDNGDVAILEIRTRRGMYLGRSDRVDDTAHLLPRGLHLTVAGVHTGRYRRPDGTTATAVFVQLTDTE